MIFVMSFVDKNFKKVETTSRQNVYISQSQRTPISMKCLLIAAFTFCVFSLTYGQDVVSSTDPSVKKLTSSEPPPEPLYVISEGGIRKEATEEDLGKIKLTDIESVEMLIDAAALYEYGEKGKHGVMIICVRKD